MQKDRKWYRSDTGKEISPKELIKHHNVKAQIDGNIIRAEINEPYENTLYAEINIDNWKATNIVTDGFPQEYTVDIHKNLVVSKQQGIVVISGVKGRLEKYVLKFDGYADIVYDIVSNKIQAMNIKAPVGMKVSIDIKNKKVCLVDEVNL